MIKSIGNQSKHEKIKNKKLKLKLKIKGNNKIDVSMFRLKLFEITCQC